MEKISVLEWFFAALFAIMIVIAVLLHPVAFLSTFTVTLLAMIITMRRL